MNRKPVDYLILKELRKNGRMSITKMARRLNVPLSTVADRCIMLHNELIQRSTIFFDFKELGYYVRAHCSIGVGRQERFVLKKYLTEHKNVNNMYRINNGYDFLIETLFMDMKEYEDFLCDLQKAFAITKLDTQLLLHDIVKERFYTQEEGKHEVTSA